MQATLGIAAHTSGERRALRSDAKTMRSHNAEETLHSYLRRHFEKVSKRRAAQLPEQQEGSDAEFVLDAPPVEVSGK